MVLSRVKYEKALTYGFLPIKKLVKKLKAGIEIPVSVINRAALAESIGDIAINGVLRLFRQVSDCDVELRSGTPISKLERIRDLYNKRYSDDCEVSAQMVGYIKKHKLPPVSEFVPKLVESVDAMLYNINNELTLLDSLSTWEVRGAKQEAMVKYANAIFNTGDEQ